MVFGHLLENRTGQTVLANRRIMAARSEQLRRDANWNLETDVHDVFASLILPTAITSEE